MIALQQRAEGVVLPVRARAGGRANSLQGEHDGALKVSVTTAPEKGKANQAIAALLCRELGLRKGQVELIAGATSPRKQFLLRDVSADELQKRIEAAVK